LDLTFQTRKLIHENRPATLYWLDDSYMCICINDIKDLQQAETTEFVVAVSEHFSYKVPLIIDRINHYSVDDDSFKFTKELAPLCFTAIAFVSHDAQGAWANQYAIDRFSAVLPSEVFTDYGSAID
jgi:hypothetical protein